MQTSVLDTSSFRLPDLLDGERYALFLDFDGTLVEIAERPDAVRLDAGTHDALRRLIVALDGAVAIVTGREIAEIDRFLAPLKLPVAGVHGLTRRDIDGRVIAPASDGGVTRAVEAAAAPLLAEYPELLLERKSAAVALHYRLRPELEAECIDTVERAVAGLSDVEVKRGKMVIEAKEGTHDKGDAVAEYLNERPFFGRRPVFAGDDVTDEDAFAIVNARGGISIKIGAGATRATYRAAGTTEFLAWLQRTAQAFGRPVDH